MIVSQHPYSHRNPSKAKYRSPKSAKCKNGICVCLCVSVFLCVWCAIYKLSINMKALSSTMQTGEPHKEIC